MRGKHHVVVESPRLKYEFDIRKNLTIVRGDSATGKTTLIELLEDCRAGEDSVVRIISDVPCRAFSDRGDTWKQSLQVITNSIVFIDEGNSFVRSADFAEVVRSSSNYFVLITREALPELPYSIREIYGIRSSGRFHFPDQIYHEFYPLYHENGEFGLTDGRERRIVTEDSQAGFQFFRGLSDCAATCICAGGNAKVFRLLGEQPDDVLLAVIADGAAFGPFMDKVMNLAETRGGMLLYFPESFEWIILRSGVSSRRGCPVELEQPEDHIDSEVYMSWERFFTDLLKRETKDDPLRRYQKSRLQPYYLHGKVRDRILSVMPAQLQRFFRKL